MTKKLFMEKYDKAIRTLSKEREVDMGVAMDMLVAHSRNKDKAPEELADEAYYYNFDGCEELDYEELAEDIKALEDNGVIPKLV
jgi:predicted Zn-dependent peptidase